MVSKSTSATLNVRRELGKVTFRKDFRDCYWDQGKQMGQGTSHYLSPGGRGGQKEGSVETENPKGEITENFGRIQRGDHSNLVGK